MSVTVKNLQKKKHSKEKFAGLSLYDATLARLASEAELDFILVGDSVAQVCQGASSTLHATMETMVYHTQCVAVGNTHALLIADMPFMSYQNTDIALENAAKLMRAGASMVKLEGGAHLTETVARLKEQGIPVCGHLGLTPQSVNLSGYAVQGKTPEAADKLCQDAEALAAAGADLLVLECIPQSLAADLTASLSIPTIGIGAGSATDGQILVAYDLLGVSEHTPKFVRNFLETSSGIQEAFQQYATAVKENTFPSAQESYGE